MKILCAYLLQRAALQGFGVKHQGNGRRPCPVIHFVKRYAGAAPLQGNNANSKSPGARALAPGH